MIINLTTIIIALVGIILGAVITGLVFNSKNSTVKANLESANHLLEETKRQSQTDLQEAKDNYEQRLTDMKADEQRHYESALEAKDKANEEAMKTLKAHYEEAVKD